jgi:hypothetical protein
MQDGDDLDQKDWNDLLLIGFDISKWIIENTKVEVTQVTEQVHLQPSRSLKKKKRHKR